MLEEFAMQELLMSGNVNVQFSVTGKDLREFGESLIRKAVEQFAPQKEEKYLKIAEVTTMLKVDRSTLYCWDKKNYLKPVRVGGKPRYKLSDVEAIMSR